MASKLKMIFRAGVVAEVRKWNAPRPEMKHFKFSNRWGHLGREVVRAVADKVREEEGTHTDFSVHVYDKLIMFSSENSIFEFHLLNDPVNIKVETPTEAPQTTEDFILLSDIDDEVVTEFGPEPLKVKSERELMVEEKERLEGIKKRSRGEESDLQNKNEHGSGWREGFQEMIQKCSMFLIMLSRVKTIQQSSNSLFPYELQEVVHANAEVTGEAAKFNLLLKLKRGGDKEEKFKVEVHKNHEGVLRLNHMEE